MIGLGLAVPFAFAMAALVSPAAGRASERLGWALGLRVATLMSAAALGMVGWFASGVPVIAVAFAAIAGGQTDALYDIDGDGDITEPTPLDLDLTPRFVDDPLAPDVGAGTPPLVDMGCYEYVYHGTSIIVR